MTALRTMHLNLFLTHVGHHEAAWRHPDTDLSQIYKFDHYQRLTQLAEEAKFDSIFFADRLSISPQAVAHGAASGYEPLTLMSALAVVTHRIGLIGTVSTSFNDPFNLARRFSSIDRLSMGRVGWNIVTSGTDVEAQNFSYDSSPLHRERYERANEFVEVALKLWDSWSPDALILDQQNGVFADPNRVREIQHRGTYFAVRGPLNMPRSPQGRPLLVQAGSSEDGKEFAAKWAEAIFTAQQTFDDAKKFYSDIKTRVAQAGRDPARVKVLPGICPIIGTTKSEAKAKERRLHTLTTPEYSLSQLSNRIGFDLSPYPLDGPFPELPMDKVEGHRSRSELIADLAKRENLTIRDLLVRLAGGRGHKTITGTPKDIADEMERWFCDGAADGFNVMPQLMFGGLEEFIEHIIPELRRRGLFRTEYEGTTLREHYGLV
ncbi:LLM class flavin-dependent oxidoreductase [Alicyclobacillus acidiphilus]|uniref:LLM class flavin-dependent oxidoreductase n=1 Tax=Alicyclobacillus acidiphilus TaxID=182455 RepID=UPI00083486D4|nr:LLM class flavin-dependent oxidoreductase [Alicyclobacillus acidiphilus]